MTDIDLLAAEIGVSGRTLRRAASRGLIRYTRSNGARYDITAGERRYVRTHWDTLKELLGFLRTEPNVRLAVLFGSLARGDDRRESDVDLLVRFARPERLAATQLALNLGDRLGRGVQIVLLEDAENTPLLLADILREGRVLIDGDGAWARIARRAATVDRLARREEASLERAAWQTLEMRAR